MSRTEEITEYLKYTFTDTEILELSKGLAKHNQDMGELEAEKKRITADFSAKIQREQAEIDSIARKVYSGYEFRNVKCHVNYHSPRENFKTIIRLDSGELVKEEAMTPAEKQEILPFIAEHANGKEQAKAND